MFRLFAVMLFVVALALPGVAQTKRPVSGVVAASSGEVLISYAEDDGDGIGRIAGIGDPIYLNDTIRTGPGTKLQVLLKDQTVFTIGPNAELVFDEFVYDPAGAVEPVLSATVKKGVFKFISGKVSAQKPGAMTLNLPNSTASIRGTTVAGRVGDDGETDLVLLTGAISVTSVASPAPIDVFQSGWGVSVSSDGLVDDPFPVPADIVNDILSIASFQLNEAGLGGTASVDGAGETGAPQLTAEQQVVADFVVDATETLAGDGQTEVNVGDLLQLITQNEELSALLLANGLDVETVPDINYAYLDTRLISILAGGGGPVPFRLQDDGDGTYSIDHSGLSAAAAAVLSPPYSGSVRFNASDLDLSPDETASSASGTASYDYTLNLDTASVTGSFSVSNVVINGNAYGSGSSSFTDESLAGKDQVGYDDDNDMVLSVGDEIFYVTPDTIALSNAGNNATVSLEITAGSVTDGTEANTIGGLYGGTNVYVLDNSDPDISARVEKYEVGRKVE
ncbi:MAG: FecR family protein [Candidatus Puniceispirillales bacterium]